MALVYMAHSNILRDSPTYMTVTSEVLPSQSTLAAAAGGDGIAHDFGSLGVLVACCKLPRRRPVGRCASIMMMITMGPGQAGVCHFESVVAPSGAPPCGRGAAQCAS